MRIKIAHWIMRGYSIRVKETTKPDSKWRTYRPDPTVFQRVRLALAMLIAGKEGIRA